MTADEFEQRYLRQMNPRQREAVLSERERLLLLAVPGSGKTTVLVHRLGYMVRVLGIQPEHILTMTYTVAATEEMRTRFGELFGWEYAEAVAFRTINGLSARIIGWYARNVSGRPAFDLLTDEGELTRLLRRLMTTASQGEYPDDSTLNELRREITFCKNMLLTEEELNNRKTDIPGFPEVYKAYNDALREKKLMDYDDQMLYALRILRSAPRVLSHFRELYPFLLVDEAQDTSRVQHEIIRLLTGEEGQLFMVGDEDQSIYGFRAAYPKALLDFEQTYRRAGVLMLEENYRSSPEIASLANAFIAQNTSRYAKAIVPTRPSGKAVELRSLRSREEQYTVLTEAAAGCVRPTAVLYRNNDSALPLIDRLERAGAPYRCRSFDPSFFTHRVVKDVRDIIFFAFHPADGECFLRIYYKFGIAVKKQAAQEAVKRASKSGKSILAELCKLPGQTERVRGMLEELQENLSLLRQKTGADVISHIWYSLNYRAFLMERRLDQGKYTVLRSIAGGAAGPESFVQRLDRLRSLIANHVNEENVPFVLSTIHSAKGLEWERVFLLDVQDGILPSADPGEGETEEERQRLREAYQEERRLFYVAVTRAKDELTLFSYPGSASRFIREAKDVLQPPEEKRENVSTVSLPPPKKRLGTVPVPAERVSAPAPKPSGSPAVPRVGEKYRHRSFGTGTVTGVEKDKVTLRFPGVGVKTLLFSEAVRRGLLKREE